MEMNKLGIRVLFLIFTLFYFTEGKGCPEKTRPHLTRCELFYKCIELPSRKHVWGLEKCDKGLVYIHNLRMCALPGDDWECTLDDLQSKQSLYVTKGNLLKNNESELQSKTSNKDADIYIVSDSESSLNEHLDDDKVEIVLKSNINNEEESDEDNALYESSGDGSDLTDGFLQATNKETSDIMQEMHEIHVDERPMDIKSHESQSSQIDPNLTAHLQRLSQLIDGLKQTYQNKDKEQIELGPDQLNAFLAHFNIKSKYDSLDPNVQDNHNNMLMIARTTTVAPNVAVVAGNNNNSDNAHFNQGLNRTKLRDNFNNKLEPETKVVLLNSIPQHYASAGYSNSQIVVNRPEGSVLFRLPSYESTDYAHNVPKISEETLKTVLELSKQMIANQNVPKVIPNPAFYSQPIIQPLFLPPTAYSPALQRPPSSMGSPFSSYYGSASDGNNDYEDHGVEYNRPLIPIYNKPLYGNKKPHRPHKIYGGKPGNTIIHNNVIPVHVTSTGSGEKEVVDSYGHSLGLYPPIGIDSGENKNNGYTFQVTHQYENNKFVTTVRPHVSTTATNPYAGISSSYPIDNSVTTVRPPLEYQPTPANIAQYYTPSPHLSSNNVNTLFQKPDQHINIQYGGFPRPIDINRPDSYHQQVERPSSYQTPNQNALFPPQIDPSKVEIYPNAEKIESMETEDNGSHNDRTSFNTYSNTYKNPLSSSSPQFGDEVALSAYSSNKFKNPYLPRPQPTYGSSFFQGATKPKFPNYNESPQLVNIGGNFISYDAFQNTFLPLLGQTGGTDSTFNNIEVISCQAGIRQPNITDCTRYYVCSKKDGKVLSYSCPPYTAFNGETRICDARTYALCVPNAIMSSYTVNENKRLQFEAIQALNEAKRRRVNALKVQNIANMLQQYNSQLNTQSIYVPQSSIDNINVENDNKDFLNTYVHQAAAMTVSSTTTKPLKKRKYYCKEGDKVPDQTSIYNYFVCYKNADGMMKGHKMTCSKGLLFCPMTKVCTLPSKCS